MRTNNLLYCADNLNILCIYIKDESVNPLDLREVGGLTLL